jgi:hypothetical protein
VGVDPEVAAILSAVLGAVLIGLPGLHRSVRRRRRALHECIVCSRTRVLGERTCDCADEAM